MSAGVSWEFQLDGDEVEDQTWDWRRGAPQVQLLQGVRRPLSHSRSAHIPVRAYSARTGAALQVESGLEHDLVRVLDRDPSVAWMVAQPCRLRFTPEVGRPTSHVPDLLVQSVTREVTIWDVKPLSKVDEKFGRISALTADACDHVGWAYKTFHGLAEAERLNVLWLNGFRLRRPWHDLWRPRVLDAVTGRGRAGLTVGELMGLDDGSGEGISTLWHLIWAGQLAADLASPLTMTSAVTVTGSEGVL